MKLMKIYLAQPRGFCAGVDRAISIVQFALEKFNTPVYVRHEIVHNYHVVKQLKEKGAIFVDNLEEIPEGSVTIFSAHGVSPEIRRQAQARRLRIIDATCPLVTKVHSEAKRYAGEGCHIILLGHRKHVEVEGTMGEAPDNITLVENLDDLDRITLPKDKPVAILTQTTLAVDETQHMMQVIKDRYPHVMQPKAKDICFATTNRQKAVKELAKICDLIIVVGSPTSSNSNRLAEVAKSCGTKSILIDDLNGLSLEILQNVSSLGITAGASAPEFVVKDILKWLQQHFQTEIDTVNVGSEEASFSIDKDLKQIDSL
ncbi:4-hydroxy-3-methylbut-2-enyl diphosphate reductase [bacterium]|nr:4-hydroxy-3-methylbut-2-enyl diphosphate reductase [bacterium]